MKAVESYLKFAAQVIATVIAGIIAALADNRLSDLEWINVVILGLGSVAVLGAGNMSDGVWKYTKLIVSAATAGAVVLHTLIADGIDLGTSQWLQILVAVLAALGVFGVKGPLVEPVSRVHGATRDGKHAER